MHGAAHHLKALELASSTVSSECQCAQQGYAGIGRQLHHLEALGGRCCGFKLGIFVIRILIYAIDIQESLLYTIATRLRSIR